MQKGLNRALLLFLCLEPKFLQHALEGVVEKCRNEECRQIHYSQYDQKQPSKKVAEKYP